MNNIDKKIPELERWNHVILYSKGWYKRTDTIEDLKTLISKLCGIDREYESLKDIAYVVTEVFIRVHTKDQIERFFNDVIFSNVYFNESFSREYIIKRMIGWIGCMQVMEKDGEHIINIGEPDYTLLPPKDDEQIERYKELYTQIEKPTGSKA
jgi:hypothetical protein